MIFKEKTKSLPISKQMVWKAYQKVKRNQGSAGVDAVSLAAFDGQRHKHLYKLWNRLASGSYFPPAVLEVEIPKAGSVAGKGRKLGIPTVSDRIAQEVIKSYLEPRLEKVFHSNSYGYRPGRSAHQALGKVRENVRQYGWVLDLDIKSFFDEVEHSLLMKALERHVEEKWVKMYLKRWLEAPIEGFDGKRRYRNGKGTPQGGVISPLLANLYLHYSLDKWIEKHLPGIAFVRYADDIILHAVSERQATYLLTKIKARLQACKLSLNEEKSKVVYCQDYRRKKLNRPTRFDFLGYSFRPRSAKSAKGGMFLGYDCGISKKSSKRIAAQWRKQRFYRWSHLELADLAKHFNAQLRGIIQYYGRYRPEALAKLLQRFDRLLAKWASNKYKQVGRSKKRAYDWLRSICASYPSLFVHWQYYPVT